MLFQSSYKRKIVKTYHKHFRIMVTATSLQGAYYRFFQHAKAYHIHLLVTQPCLTLAAPNTGVGGHSFLQGIFLTQELNLRLLCLLCRTGSLPSEPNGKPIIFYKENKKCCFSESKRLSSGRQGVCSLGRNGSLEIR